MSDDLAQRLRRFAGRERSKAGDAETPFRQALHEARANTMEQAADRIDALAEMTTDREFWRDPKEAVEVDVDREYKRAETAEETILAKDRTSPSRCWLNVYGCKGNCGNYGCGN